MAKERYQDLIFQLGDIARERLVERPDRPRSINRVLQAEEAVVLRREELADLEAQMNEEDAAFDEWMAQVKAERDQKAVVVKRFQRAVDSVEGRVKNLRKKLSSSRADLRYNQLGVKKAEARHRDLEMTSHDPMQIETSRQNLRKIKLSVMRQERQIEEMEYEVNQVLTPTPGQPGGPGLVAHRRILELEDEVEARTAEHQAYLDELDQAIAAKEEELQAAEDYLDQAVFLLGEECYGKRLPDPALAVLYPRLDVAK